MMHTILNTIISIAVSGALGYCVSSIKNYKKQRDKILDEFKQIKENELLDMKSDLSNKFYVYDALPEVEDYLVISFQEKCQRYFDLGGNTYIHQLYEKSFEWRVKQTGYLR